MNGIQEVWLRLRGREPTPGLALAWARRQGLQWAEVTFELDGRVRTQWPPLTALSPKAQEVEQAEVSSGSAIHRSERKSAR